MGRVAHHRAYHRHGLGCRAADGPDRQVCQSFAFSLKEDLPERQFFQIWYALHLIQLFNCSTWVPAASFFLVTVGARFLDGLPAQQRLHPGTSHHAVGRNLGWTSAPVGAVPEYPFQANTEKSITYLSPAFIRAHAYF